MPIYDFLCSHCGHENDLLRKISDATMIFCPECSNETFQKQVSAPNFQLTGSGWYETDFKNKSTKNDKKDVGGSEVKPKKTEDVKKND